MSNSSDRQTTYPHFTLSDLSLPTASCQKWCILLLHLISVNKRTSARRAVEPADKYLYYTFRDSPTFMMKTSRPAGQCVAATALLRGLIVVCCLFGLEGTANAAATRGLRRLQESTTPQEFYFSEFMAESDEPVVLLEEGPFKLVASCQTVSYSYSDWDYYYSSWYSSSSSYYSYSYSFDDDWSTDDYWYNAIYNESIATLELTYTADDSDYLFGSPSYVWYPFEEKIIGSYEAGESRTQIVFSGYDGGWSRDATLQSLSGAYITTNGDNTVGFHIENANYHGNPDDYSFPEGIDCMMAGVIGYIVP